MKTIVFKDKPYHLKELFTSQQIHLRVQAMAETINQHYPQDQTLILIVVLNGGLLFASDLARCLTMPTQIDTIRLSSYSGMASTGKVQLLGALPDYIQGKNVLVIEDIVDSGRSLKFLKNELAKLKPNSLMIATLLDKPECHGPEIQPDYVGFQVENRFVIGYGLDLEGMYRNLPYIGEMIPKGE